MKSILVTGNVKLPRSQIQFGNETVLLICGLLALREQAGENSIEILHSYLVQNDSFYTFYEISILGSKMKYSALSEKAKNTPLLAAIGMNLPNLERDINFPIWN